MTHGLEEQVLQAAKRRSEALVEKDVAALDTLLADTFVYTNAGGTVMTKAEYLDLYVRNPDVRWEVQELEDVQVSVYADVAVLVARVHDVFVAPGVGRFDGYFRSTLVFVTDRNEWRCVAAQSTTTDPPAL